MLAAGLGLLLTGCFSDPDLKTSLRSEGPPEVLAVLALDLNTGAEEASFCKYVAGALDEKGPNLVQGSIICPKVETNFAAAELQPLGWGLRIIFDELLNGDAVETLDCDVTGPDGEPDGIQDNPITTCDGHIDTTNPVQVVCGGTLAYDGYYSPNGNKDSFPVGPAIVVVPDGGGAAGSTCTVTINPVVRDKQGEAVATGASINTFTLKIAALALTGTDPEDADPVDDRGVIEPDGAVYFLFNANIDDTSIGLTEVTLSTGGGVVVPAAVTVEDNAIVVAGAADLAPGDYTAKITAGASFDESNGGSITIAAEVAVRFVVAAP